MPVTIAYDEVALTITETRAPGLDGLGQPCGAITFVRQYDADLQLLYQDTSYVDATGITREQRFDRAITASATFCLDDQ